MSITLDNAIQKRDLNGDLFTISQVEVDNVQFTREGHVCVNYRDIVTKQYAGTKQFSTPAAVDNIIGQIDTYVTAQGIVAGTKD